MAHERPIERAVLTSTPPLMDIKTYIIHCPSGTLQTVTVLRYLYDKITCDLKTLLFFSHG